jgi:hypothetical protein
MDFEQAEVKNGMVYLYDEDGFVNINGILHKDVKNIMDFFNPFVLNEESADGEFIVDNVYPLDLSLVFYDDGEFTIEGRIWNLDTNDSSYFHSFNFEGASVEDWIEVYDFIKKEGK